MTLPLLVIFGLATGPPAGVGDGLRFIPLHALTTLLFALGAFCLCEFRVSQQISTFYGSSVQSMGIQLNVLPALPVRARSVSGCLNSALLGLERNRPAVVTSQLLGEPASALLCSCFASEVACPDRPSCPRDQSTY